MITETADDRTPEGGPISTYSIRPPPDQKFNREAVRECVKLSLHEELGDKTYDAADAEGWTKSVSESLQFKIKELKYDRYKFLVHVVISEQKGQGIKMCCRCLWDADTDTFFSEVLSTDTFVCVVAVYASYYY